MFPETFCSQCGSAFGPGESGYSHCADHRVRPSIEDLEEANVLFKQLIITIQRIPEAGEVLCRLMDANAAFEEVLCREENHAS
ncbi:MAG: hypothetical protein ACYDBI_05960 [Thermoplasmataceae archaeon]